MRIIGDAFVKRVSGCQEQPKVVKKVDVCIKVLSRLLTSHSSAVYTCIKKTRIFFAFGFFVESY